MPLPTKSPTSKTRALPRRWARFFSLKASSLFTYQGKRYFKSVFPFRAFAIGRDFGSRATFFAPWTRVQTDVLVRDARPGGKSSSSYKAYDGEFPDGVSGNEGGVGPQGVPGPTDGFAVRGPSGPGFKNAAEEHASWETAGGTTPEQNESRVFPPQPNSDNNVTGPTS